MIKLMYITNQPDIAKIAENSGVDRVWIDLEIKGKELRQGGMDTVKSRHKIEDISKVKKVLNKSELIVRVNPINEESEEEINKVIEQGADIVMLPYFKTVEEVKKFVKYVDNRTKICLLCETPGAVENIDEILKVDGVNEIHIGLNDLHLGYNKTFMFELLTDGTVEKLCEKFKNAGIKYGFGGVARVGEGTLPAENIIIEHYRLGSSIAILSRSFCNTEKITDINQIKEIFKTGVEDIRKVEKRANTYTNTEFENNKQFITNNIKKIVNQIKNAQKFS